MNKLIEELNNWGADTKGAIARFIGDEKLYAECVRMVLDDKGFILLAKALEDGDYPSAFEAAHSLKGVLGNLGLTPLFDKASVITEALRAGRYENITEQYTMIKTEYKKLVEILKGNSEQ